MKKKKKFNYVITIHNKEDLLEKVLDASESLPGIKDQKVELENLVTA